MKIELNDKELREIIAAKFDVSPEEIKFETYTEYDDDVWHDTVERVTVRIEI